MLALLRARRRAAVACEGVWGLPTPLRAPPGPRKNALIIVDTQLCFTNELTPSSPYAVCNPPATGGTDTCSREGSLVFAMPGSAVGA